MNDAIKSLDTTNSFWKNKNTVKILFPTSNKIDESGLKKIRNELAKHYYSIISKGKDLEVNAKFSFPDNEEGKEKYQELINHFATGDDVVISGDFIEEFNFPDWWNRLFGNISTSGLLLKMSSPKLNIVIPCRFTLESESDRVTIDYIEFRDIKHGSEQITLTNELQDNSLKIKLIVYISKKSIKVSIEYKNADFETLLKVNRITNIIHTGGIIRIRNYNNNDDDEISLPFSKSNIKPKSDFIIDFLEKVCHIQKTTGLKFQPRENGFITKGDYYSANKIIKIIIDGKWIENNLSFTITFTRHGIENLLNKNKENLPTNFLLKRDDSALRFLSTNIDLGPVNQEIIGECDFSYEEIQSWFYKAAKDDSFEYRLKNVPLVEEYSKWVRHNNTENSLQQ